MEGNKDEEDEEDELQRIRTRQVGGEGGDGGERAASGSLWVRVGGVWHLVCFV